MYSLFRNPSASSFSKDVEGEAENAPFISSKVVGHTDGSARTHRSRWICHWILHATTVLLLVAILFREKWSQTCASTNPYSSVYGAIGDHSIISTLDGSFWGKSPYKGPPTNEVMRAWDAITHVPHLNLTAEEMSKMGRSLDSVQYPEEFGGGYLAFSEAAHQLHCLQSLWEDHHYSRFPEYFPTLTEKLAILPEIMEHHFEHCVDVIRQQLMCTADPAFVTFRWVEGVQGPYPDFKSKHVCRSYDALMDWGESRKAIGIPDGYQWPVPESGIVKLAKAP